MAKVVNELMACIDCLLYVANGDLPEDDTGQLEEAIGEHLDLSVHQYLVCGDNDKDDEFSWRACECCGSTLGGSRHLLVLLEDDHAPTYGYERTTP